MRCIIDFIFGGTVLVLEKLDYAVGCTYRQINVVIWFVAVPVVVAVLLDILLHTFICTAATLTIITAITLIATLTKQLCRLIDFIFEKSVESLLELNNIFGIDYNAASVWVCVVIPVIVVVALIVVVIII